MDDLREELLRERGGIRWIGSWRTRRAARAVRSQLDAFAALLAESDAPDPHDREILAEALAVTLRNHDGVREYFRKRRLESLQDEDGWQDHLRQIAEKLTDEWKPKSTERAAPLAPVRSRDWIEGLLEAAVVAGHELCGKDGAGSAEAARRESYFEVAKVRIDDVVVRRRGGSPARSAGLQPQLPLPNALDPSLEQLEYVAPPLADELQSDLAAVLAGGFRACLLSGERGIGKSRAGHEIARAAHADGANVAFAGDLRVGDPTGPYGQVLTALAPLFLSPQLSRGVEQLDHLHTIAGFSPLLRGRLSPRPAEPPADDGLLREALLAVIHDLPRERSFVLLLDGVDPADRQILRLAQELIALAPDRLMLLMTGPFDELDEPWPRHVRRVEALPPKLGTKLAQARLGEADDKRKAAELARRTGNHPFLIVNNAEPNRIFEKVVLPEVDEMAAGGERILRCAALLRAPLDEELLAAVSDSEVDTVKSVLATDLFRNVPSEGSDFKHDLVREAVLDQAGTQAQVSLARTIAARLPDEGRLAVQRAELWSLVAGWDQAEAGPAARHCAAAAQHLTECASYGGALTFYSKAIDLATRAGEPHLALEMQLGKATSNWAMGEFKSARDEFHETASAADDPVLLARAALGFGGRLGFSGVTTDHRHVPLLRRAHNALDEASPLRLRVQGALVGALAFAGRDEAATAENRRLARATLEAAREEGDPQRLAEVCACVCWALWEPDEVSERAALAAEFVDAAVRSGEVGLMLEARMFRLACNLEQSEMETVMTDLEECRRLARRAQQSHYNGLVSLLEAMERLGAGELDAAEEVGLKALDHGRRDENPAIFELYSAQLLLVRLLQGRPDRVLSAAKMMAAAFPRMPVWTAGVALICAEIGRLDEARERVETIAADGFRGVPRDIFWLLTLEHCARIAVRLRMKDLAAELYRQLRPYSGRVIAAGAGIAVYGSVDRALGLLAGLLGEDDEAVSRLEHAQEANARVGADAVNLLVRHELVAALRGRGAPGDSERAAALVAETAVDARRLGIELRPTAQARRLATERRGPRRWMSKRGVRRLSAFLAARIEGKTDTEIEAVVIGSRALAAGMPLTFRREVACGWTGTIELVFTRPVGRRNPRGVWTLQIDRRARVRRRRLDSSPDIRLELSAATFVRLLAGTENGVRAWLDGLIVVHGDPSVAACLVEMFDGPMPFGPTGFTVAS